MMQTRRRPTLQKRWIPKPHQDVAVRFLIKHHYAALLMDPGLGKTTVALRAFQVVRKARSCHNALVIAPKRVAYNVWTHDEGGEFWEWAEDFGDLEVTLLHGPKKDERLKEDADIYVTNVDSIRWLVEDGGLDFLIRKKKVDCLIIDELSRFKRPKIKRFKMIKPFLGRFRRRWGLTGSPAPNGLIDLFGQIYMIDQGATLGQYITRYRHKYFYPSGYGGYTWTLQEGSEKKIHKALKKVAVSMRAQDHLELPALITQNLWVNLPQKVRKHYNDLEKKYITAIEEDMIIAANAAVARGKCRQAASGGLYVDEGHRKRKSIMLHDEKTNALMELINELQGQPLLVAYEFHHDLERISVAFKKKKWEVHALNGKTTEKRTSELIKMWNFGLLRVLFAHPAAVGHGLNLQKSSGSHICWYSLTWDFELYDQFIRRVWRQGNDSERVVVHRILARDTVDSDIEKVLKKKKRRQDALIEALKTRVKLRRKKK